MKPVYFAILVNIGVFIAAVALSNLVPVLGAIVCLFSYPTIGYLGYIIAKYPLSIRIEATDATPRQQKSPSPAPAGNKRKSRLRTLEQ